MTIDAGNDYIDFSPAQKDALILQRVPITPRPEMPMIPRTPRKTRLERMPLSGATSTMMRVIRRARVERLPEYFEQTCDWREHEIAVICGSSQLTYRELDQRANRLAHFFISRGVGKGDPIGILLERSLDTYIVLLGILKAGAAFVPLDPSFPSDLVAFIAQDAELRGLVTTSAFRPKTSALRCAVLELDQADEELSLQLETRPQILVDPASLCYIIYTSSSTGRPKGVAVSHANIVNFLREVMPIYRVTRYDRVYQGMSIALDFSFKEIWPTWIAGATLVAGPTDFQRFNRGLTEFLIEHKITVFCCTPTMLASIERDVPSLRALFISGEACPTYLINRWSRPGLRMLNTYGPTETTVMATWCELFPTRPVTIGSPLPTYQVYILDDQLRPVEEGQCGEICIGGSGVALGYHNRPDLTREHFIPNPVLGDQEVVPRLYRTGDLGRVTPVGEIEYLRRIDAQDNYHIGANPIEQLVLAQVDPVFLSEYASAPPAAARAISTFEAETVKLEVPKRWDLKNIYKQVLTDPLYRNSLFSMASTFILGGLGFVFWIIIARLYRTEDVGIATTLISIMTLLSTFTIMGLNVTLNRYLPKSAHKNDLINSSFVIVTIFTLLASVIFLLGLESFSPQLLFLRENIYYSISFILLVVFAAWDILVHSIFMAFRAAANILIKNTIISILKLVLPFILIAFGAYGIFASNASSFALGMLTSLVVIIVNFKVRPAISVNVSLLKETLAYSFSNYIAEFVFNMPSLVLPAIILNVLSAEYVAYFFIASMIQNLLQVIPTATAESLLTEGSYDEDELKRHVKKALVTILVILIPAIAVILAGGHLLLQFFGKNYATESYQFLQLYSVSTIFTALLLVSNAIMNVKHRMKSLIVSNVVASAFTLCLACAFISGKLVGVGWGWMLGQAIAGLVSLFLIASNLRSPSARSLPGQRKSQFVRATGINTRQSHGASQAHVTRR